jgi:Fe2+ transport system protein B
VYSLSAFAKEETEEVSEVPTEEIPEETTTPEDNSEVQKEVNYENLQDGSIFQNADIPLNEETEAEPETQVAKETDQEFFEKQQNQIQELLKEINNNNAQTSKEVENAEENIQENVEELQNNQEDEENIDHIHDELHEFHHGDPDHEKHWSNEEDSAIKKYIVYISKNYVPYIDNLTTDERSAYINDAIQKKLDEEENKRHSNKKKRVLSNVIVMCLTFFIALPIAIFVINKSILATFENYKYSQENFEKLYKQKFTNSKIYQRSIQYNKLHPKN